MLHILVKYSNDDATNKFHNTITISLRLFLPFFLFFFVARKEIMPCNLDKNADGKKPLSTHCAKQCVSLVIVSLAKIAAECLINRSFGPNDLITLMNNTCVLWLRKHFIIHLSNNLYPTMYNTCMFRFISDENRHLMSKEKTVIFKSQMGFHSTVCNLIDLNVMLLFGQHTRKPIFSISWQLWIAIWNGN